MRPYESETIQELKQKIKKQRMQLQRLDRLWKKGMVNLESAQRRNLQIYAVIDQISEELENREIF